MLGLQPLVLRIAQIRTLIAQATQANIAARILVAMTAGALPEYRWRAVRALFAKLAQFNKVMKDLWRPKRWRPSGSAFNFLKGTVHSELSTCGFSSSVVVTKVNFHRRVCVTSARSAPRRLSKTFAGLPLS
jgi:hypothetical protein